MTDKETIRKFFQRLVEQGKILQEPANYDAATLKIYIDYLEQENEKLKARLEKAVELPCKPGDTIYAIDGFDSEAEIQELVVEEIRIRRIHAWISAKLKDFDILHNYISREHGTWWFTDREAAEARLKEELRGGKKC